MKTCVTGGAGFIGSHLVDRLLEDGHDVVVLDDLSTGRLENLATAAGRIEFIEDDLRDPRAVARAVAGCEVVYHQGALAAVARSVENPEEVTDVNVGGTLNVLVAARDARVRRVVFASSSSVYGDTPELPKVETMPLSPRSPYAASKAAGEAYLSAFQASYGLETVSFRYFNVYGTAPVADVALRRGGAAVRRGDARRDGADDLRRRPPDARLHLRGRRGRRAPCAPRRPRARRTAR